MVLFHDKSPLLQQYHVNVKCKRAINDSYQIGPFKKDMKFLKYATF